METFCTDCKNHDREEPNATEMMCMCCAAPICRECAPQGRCPYGGMGLIDIE